ncbi:phosphoribosylanthranilate isomerase [Algoriphagus aquaeductus]|uniref:N-(5'-phosphoribosyl)anthranilate isomerase n=1 Tax=Algoriphagus aquaeductus TaxID=475299 RepID=A0A326RVJ1_9BACT|nr:MULTISPECIES: phosphoribosylanthranilate isomerase [Algoriphagus]MBC6366585.1 N-(5'-phosphoribosyl)anthranilate isomerase [Algoriphagus sp. AK58]PZV85524.1 phosphoribosylanthranilate isomerase [Algoriphagus aquaeductus]
MELKVCGMREPENIRSLISEVNPDWMGLIFYPKSPRYVPDEQAAELKGQPVKKVGVFVNASEAEILRKVDQFGLSAIQLHGSESPDFVKSLAEKTEAELWKVVSVGTEIDWKSLEGYLPFVSKFLFDTATAAHGGSGKRFDWKVLETYPFDKGFLLSGGLDGESAEEVLALRQQIPQLKGVDLNSKFEDAPGVKNIEKLKNFKSRLIQSGTNN